MGTYTENWVIEASDKNKVKRIFKIFKAINDGSWLTLSWDSNRWSSDDEITIKSKVGKKEKFNKLEYAVYCNNPTIVRYILDSMHGTLDINCNRNIYKQAITKGYVEVVKALAEDHSFFEHGSHKDEKGNGLFHFVDQLKNKKTRIEMATILLKQGASLRIVNDKGALPVFIDDYKKIQTQLKEVPKRNFIGKLFYGRSDQAALVKRKLNQKIEDINDLKYYLKKGKLTQGIINKYNNAFNEISNEALILSNDYDSLDAFKLVYQQPGVKNKLDSATAEELIQISMPGTRGSFKTLKYYFDIGLYNKAKEDTSTFTSCLQTALRKKRPDIVKYLLSKGVYAGPTISCDKDNWLNLYPKIENKSSFTELYESFVAMLSNLKTIVQNGFRTLFRMDKVEPIEPKLNLGTLVDYCKYERKTRFLTTKEVTCWNQMTKLISDHLRSKDSSAKHINHKGKPKPILHLHSANKDLKASCKRNTKPVAETSVKRRKVA